MDRTVTGTTIPRKSGSGSNSNEGEILTSQISRTEVSALDAV